MLRWETKVCGKKRVWICPGSYTDKKSDWQTKANSPVGKKDGAKKPEMGDKVLYRVYKGDSRGGDARSGAKLVRVKIYAKLNKVTIMPSKRRLSKRTSEEGPSIYLSIWFDSFDMLISITSFNNIAVSPVSPISASHMYYLRLETVHIHNLLPTLLQTSSTMYLSHSC